MKSIDRRDIRKHITGTGVTLICSLLATGAVLLMLSGCIKEDYPVRLVYPVLTTTSATEVTAHSAKTGGDITSDGGSDVTIRGICWSNQMNPSTADTLNRISINGAGIGQFTVTLDTLMPEREYHVRAYATSAQGTAYGQDISFTTPAED